jgi:hypothetical protein
MPIDGSQSRAVGTAAAEPHRMTTRQTAAYHERDEDDDGGLPDGVGALSSSDASRGGISTAPALNSSFDLKWWTV